MINTGLYCCAYLHEGSSVAVLLQLPPHVVREIHGVILPTGSPQRLIPVTETATNQCWYSLLPLARLAAPWSVVIHS